MVVDYFLWYRNITNVHLEDTKEISSVVFVSLDREKDIRRHHVVTKTPSSLEL